jgi:hypothetical protein
LIRSNDRRHLLAVLTHLENFHGANVHAQAVGRTLRLIYVNDPDQYESPT